MLKLDNKANQELANFLSWWGRELLSLVPERVRDVLFPQRPRLVLTREGEALALTVFDHDRVNALGRFALDEEGIKQREALFRENPLLLEAEPVLKLDSDQALLRVVKLPTAA